MPALVTFPVAENNPPVSKLPPEILAELVILPVDDTNPPVNKLPPVIFALAETIEPSKLAPDTIVVASTLLPLTLDEEIILPVEEIKPVTYSPVVANTATFDVPPTLILALPPDVPIFASVVPL